MDVAKQLVNIRNKSAVTADKYNVNSNLPPVLGGGMTVSPDMAFVFINPTARNASTWDGWLGSRWPWIGIRAVWRVLYNAGYLGKDLWEEIDARNSWNPEFAKKVYDNIANEKLYITNLVKWTSPNGDLPSKDMVDDFTNLTIRELEIVSPRAVVAFGCMTFKALTGCSVKMAEVLEVVRKSGSIPQHYLLGTETPVLPCYFPVGRGNPKGATEILRYLKLQAG